MPIPVRLNALKEVAHTVGVVAGAQHVIDRFPIGLGFVFSCVLYLQRYVDGNRDQTNQRIGSEQPERCDVPPCVAFARFREVPPAHVSDLVSQYAGEFVFIADAHERVGMKVDVPARDRESVQTASSDDVEPVDERLRFGDLDKLLTEGREVGEHDRIRYQLLPFTELDLDPRTDLLFVLDGESIG